MANGVLGRWFMWLVLISAYFYFCGIGINLCVFQFLPEYWVESSFAEFRQELCFHVDGYPKILIELCSGESSKNQFVYFS